MSTTTTFDQVYAQCQAFVGKKGNQAPQWMRYLSSVGWSYDDWVAQLMTDKGEASEF